MPGRALREGSFFEGYVLEQRLSDGHTTGYKVFLSRRLFNLTERFILKILVPSRGQDRRKALLRFERECRLLRECRNPSLIPLIKQGVSDDGYHYLVMPFAAGGTLRARLCERALSVREALVICMRLGECLRTLHARGVTHRDIKPENIVFSGPLLDDPPYLIDMSIASEGQNSITSAVDLVPRSPRYCSPEQLRGDAAIDGRSDIYNLGLVLYECLSGCQALPFCPEREHEIINAMREGFSSAWIPESVFPIVDRALRFNPEERYQTIDQMVADLGAALAREAPLRAAMRTRRHARPAIAACAALLCLVTLAYAGTRLFVRGREAASPRASHASTAAGSAPLMKGSAPAPSPEPAAPPRAAQPRTANPPPGRVRAIASAAVVPEEGAVLRVIEGLIPKMKARCPGVELKGDLVVGERGAFQAQGAAADECLARIVNGASLPPREGVYLPTHFRWSWQDRDDVRDPSSPL